VLAAIWKPVESEEAVQPVTFSVILQRMAGSGDAQIGWFASRAKFVPLVEPPPEPEPKPDSEDWWAE
jgi:hypothetical protein